MRADRRRNVLAAARILGWTSRDGTTRPTRSRTAARMGTSERTVSKCWRWLEEHHYLQVTENGTSARYRACWHGEEHNLARTWVLTLPESSPCSGGSLVEVRKSPAAVRPQPKKLSDEGRRRESARFLRAGWQIADIHFATSHTPDGTPWAFSDPPRWPRAHLRWRLSFWLGPDGCPLPSPSQLRAARFVARMAEQDRRRAERKAGTAPPPEWHDARAAMRVRATVRSTKPPTEDRWTTFRSGS